jgi:hypothetical protein
MEICCFQNAPSGPSQKHGVCHLYRVVYRRLPLEHGMMCRAGDEMSLCSSVAYWTFERFHQQLGAKSQCHTPARPSQACCSPVLGFCGVPSDFCFPFIVWMIMIVQTKGSSKTQLYKGITKNHLEPHIRNWTMPPAAWWKTFKGGAVAGVAQGGLSISNQTESTIKPREQIQAPYDSTSMVEMILYIIWINIIGIIHNFWNHHWWKW